MFSILLQSPGCDGYLGSEKVMDRCGICGGDNSTCRIVSGVFERSLSRIGYHKIVEIPEGAIKINVTEMAKSRNYLGGTPTLSMRLNMTILHLKNVSKYFQPLFRIAFSPV